jgi:tetratricopeptide (TPR) repeat protein
MKSAKFIPLLIVAATIAAYANSFKGVFVFDDYGIEHGEQLRSLWPPWAPLAVPPNQTLSARPVASYTLAINYAISGLETWSYHAFNLAFHLISALLLFGIIRRTIPKTQNPKPQNPPLDDSDATVIAAAIALLWAVHPLTTDVVTYIIQRTDGLMGMFLLLTLYCAIRGAEQRRSGVPPLAEPMKRRDAASTWWFVGATVACALGMGSKETMVVAPLVVLSYDRIFLAPRWRELFQKRWRLYAGLAATWLVLAVLVATDPHGESAGFHFEDLRPWNYLLTQAGVIVHYLELTFYPRSLTLDYWDWPIAKTVRDVLPQGIIVCALLAATAWALWKKPALGFLGLWFFLILAPTSSILPLHGEAAALRRMYLPLAAVIAAVVIGANEIFKRAGKHSATAKFAAIGLTTLLAVWLAVTTANRNRDFHSKIAIWERNVEARPNNVRARVNLGNGYNELGLTARAIEQFREALKLNPNFAAAHNNLGAALLSQQKFEEAEKHFREAIRIQSAMPKESKNLANAHYNRGRALVELKRETEAIAEFRAAVQRNPEFALAYDALGVLLEKRGQHRMAAELLARATQLEPKKAEFHHHHGIARAKLGELPAALAAYREALRLKPDFIEARVNLGLALHENGDDDAAIAELRAALRLSPNDAEANHNLGALLSGRGEDEAAFRHFLAAAEAHAQQGRRQLARDSAQRAAAVARKAGRSDLMEQLEALLKSLKISETDE